MWRKEINRKDLAEAVARRCGLTKSEAREAVNTVIETIRETLKANGRVQLRGFGTFMVVRRGQRVARNPHTGERVDIPERWDVRFKVSKVLREEINEELG